MKPIRPGETYLQVINNRQILPGAGRLFFLLKIANKRNHST